MQRPGDAGLEVWVDPAMLETWVQFLSGRSPGEGNGNPLQYSCLENPVDRGDWQATAHGVTRARHDLARSFFLYVFPSLRLLRGAGHFLRGGGRGSQRRLPWVAAQPRLQPPWPWEAAVWTVLHSSLCVFCLLRLNLAFSFWLPLPFLLIFFFLFIFDVRIFIVFHCKIFKCSSHTMYLPA